MSTIKGTTKHCCYGLCNSDSRYADRDYMQGVFWINFPKPKRTEAKCRKWVAACGRKDFTIEKVKKWTYICSKHFVGGNGPTEANPDPVPASYTPAQVEKFSRKRKAPTPRSTPVSKKTLFEVSEALLSLQHTPPVKKPQVNQQHHDDSTDQALPEEICPDFIATPIKTVDNETQTTYSCSEQISNKIEKRILQNKQRIVSTKKSTQQKSKFSFDILKKDEKLFKFYTGLTVLQFNHLFNALGESVHTLKYWLGNKTSNRKRRKGKAEKKLCAENQLLLTLMKLRQNFPNKDLAHRFSVSPSTISSIIITWIQFLYKMTQPLWDRMFPSRELIQEHLPACFKSFRNVRIIIDCFEIFVQSSGNFAEQGNMYSSYKNHTTLKCLVGIAPTGAVTFLSDVYEGSKSDRDCY
ncbi:uncharacterized protein LOC123525403 [Mercenaria mercenaria]|uniref:uncharacterized protein LOC123525403 n=1 Tax=Mercenaria mercenaria TaxID=6596 RepID=UPI00234EDF01|nr:uncharacterized protein LOC123525403 [Mercenaria mercenaria]